MRKVLPVSGAAIGLGAWLYCFFFLKNYAMSAIVKIVSCNGSILSYVSRLLAAPVDVKTEVRCNFNK